VSAETYRYDYPKHRLLTRKEFTFHVARYFGFALQILGFGLGVGILGYHFIARLGWIDSFLNASMILGGMGPVDTLHSAAAKVFASCYALFSGLAFIGIASVIFTPFAHRILHRFHLDQEDRAQSRKIDD
jgi:hypothetical protein